jgi:hypothetical protein
MLVGDNVIEDVPYPYWAAATPSSATDVSTETVAIIRSASIPFATIIPRKAPMDILHIESLKTLLIVFVLL